MLGSLLRRDETPLVVGELIDIAGHEVTVCLAVACEGVGLHWEGEERLEDFSWPYFVDFPRHVSFGLEPGFFDEARPDAGLVDRL